MYIQYSWIGILFLLLSCSNDKSDRLAANYSVLFCYLVEVGYQYHHTFLSLDNKMYIPSVRAKYHHNSLVGLDVYKSEGEIHYTREDLDNDTVFIKLLNIKKLRAVKLEDKLLNDNNIQYAIYQIKSDSIFCLKGDSLLIYTNFK